MADVLSTDLRSVTWSLNSCGEMARCTVRFRTSSFLEIVTQFDKIGEAGSDAQEDHAMGSVNHPKALRSHCDGEHEGGFL